MASWIFQNSPLILALIGIVITLSGGIYFLILTKLKSDLAEIVKKEVSVLKEPFYRKGEIHRLFITPDKLNDTMRIVDFRLRIIEELLKGRETLGKLNG